MSTKVQVEVARGYAMPAVCCACGASATNSSVQAVGADTETRERISMHFPLCADCGHVMQAAGGWRGKAGRLRVATDQQKQFEKIDGAVRIQPYHATVGSKEPTLTIEFTNTAFAKEFETENAKR